MLVFTWEKHESKQKIRLYIIKKWDSHKTKPFVKKVGFRRFPLAVAKVGFRVTIC